MKRRLRSCSHANCTTGAGWALTKEYEPPQARREEARHLLESEQQAANRRAESDGDANRRSWGAGQSNIDQSGELIEDAVRTGSWPCKQHQMRNGCTCRDEVALVLRVLEAREQARAEVHRGGVALAECRPDLHLRHHMLRGQSGTLQLPAAIAWRPQTGKSH